MNKPDQDTESSVNTETQQESFNPYEPPKAAVHQDFSEEYQNVATRGSRLLASLIDGLIGLTYVVPFFYLFGVLDVIKEGKTLPITMQIMMSVFGFIFYACIHGFWLYKYGQSVGKRLMKIYIADIKTNEKADIKTIVFKRFIPKSCISLVPYVGQFLNLINILFIFRKDVRCVHDHLAGTVVLKAPEGY